MRLAVDATPAAKWATLLAIARLQARVVPRLLLLLLHVVAVEASEADSVAEVMVSQPTVLRHVTSAEVPTTMLVTARRRP